MTPKKWLERIKKEKIAIYCVSPEGEDTCLEKIGDFKFLRGEHNKNKIMGIAQDHKGNKYTIRVASCGLPRCYCYASAELIV